MNKRVFDYIKKKIVMIKNLNSREFIKKRFDFYKDNFVNLNFLKTLKTSFHKAQDKVEKSFKAIVFDESLLKQSNFWINDRQHSPEPVDNSDSECSRGRRGRQEHEESASKAESST